MLKRDIEFNKERDREGEKDGWKRKIKKWVKNKASENDRKIEKKKKPGEIEWLSQIEWESKREKQRERERTRARAKLCVCVWDI